jgi:hypothetical protein
MNYEQERMQVNFKIYISILLEGLRTATKILSAEQVTRELPADSSV